MPLRTRTDAACRCAYLPLYSRNIHVRAILRYGDSTIVMRLPLLIKHDRRRWKRHWFNRSIQVSHGAHRIDGIGLKVSGGGMYLFAIADLPVGSEIRIAFNVPGSGERIEVSGAVRHRAVYLYGVEFLLDEHHEALSTKLGATLNQSSPLLH